MLHRGWIVAGMCLLAACHTDAYDYSYQAGPRQPGADIQLTFNPEQDYWPTWTEDSTGLMYAFVYGPAQTAHRCIGVMPAQGGQRTWELCDNVPSQDSLSSYPAFALGHDGRLLYLEGKVARKFLFAPITPILWLSDTSNLHPRRKLLTLPVTVGDSSITWLGDMEWTGPTSFIALGQKLLPAGQGMSSSIDSIFTGGMIVRGTIDSAGATLTPVSGTEGATSYSFAEQGATIVFTLRNSTALFRVAVAGGTATVAATAGTGAGIQLTGVSCRGESCVVAVSPVMVWPTPNDVPERVTGAGQLRLVSLTTGASTLLETRTGGIFSNPLIGPTGDVAAEFGTEVGHIQTLSSMQVDLRLYKNLVP